MGLFKKADAVIRDDVALAARGLKCEKPKVLARLSALAPAGERVVAVAQGRSGMTVHLAVLTESRVLVRKEHNGMVSKVEDEVFALPRIASVEVKGVGVAKVIINAGGSSCTLELVPRKDADVFARELTSRMG